MRRLRWLPVLLVLAGCADEIPQNVSEEMDAARAASGADTAALAGDSVRVEQLLATAPPGGYADWVADIRAGLDSVTVDAAIDRGDAIHSAQELQARRYDYLVQFYGPQGVSFAGEPLAAAVEQVGARLQELMRRLADNQADSTAIAQSVQAVKTALAEVDSQARAAGLPPTAPRLPVTTSD